MSAPRRAWGAARLARSKVSGLVEVIPTHLSYHPSQLEERILRHVISLTKAHYCYRSVCEGLPDHLQEMVPDLRALDYSRVRMIQAPLLKAIRGYIEDHDPDLKVSNQKIAFHLSGRKLDQAAGVPRCPFGHRGQQCALRPCLDTGSTVLVVERGTDPSTEH